jgi:hypothetical protein
VPQVETYGVEPIPFELRTVGWRDLFAINFTFFLSPVMMVLGALAVLEGGLPLPWAMALGQALAFAMLVVARPGVDDNYWCVRGVNVAAAVAVAAGVGIYYAVPDTWSKVLWGVAAAAGVFLLAAVPRRAAGGRSPVAARPEPEPES